MTSKPSTQQIMMSKPNYLTSTSETKAAAIQMSSYCIGSTLIQVFPSFLCLTKGVVFWGTHLISSAHRYAVAKSAVYFRLFFQASQAAASVKSDSPLGCRIRSSPPLALSAKGGRFERNYCCNEAWTSSAWEGNTPVLPHAWIPRWQSILLQSHPKRRCGATAEGVCTPLRTGGNTHL